MKKKMYLLTLVLFPVIMLNVFPMLDRVLAEYVRQTFDVTYITYRLILVSVSAFSSGCLFFYLVDHSKRYAADTSVFLCLILHFVLTAYNTLCCFFHALRLPILAYPSLDYAVICFGVGLCLFIRGLAAYIQGKRNRETN